MKIENCIYTYDEFNRLIDCVLWGGAREFAAIRGDEATEQAEKLGLTIAGKLLPECGYIFRYTRNRDKLVPARVSMHPKTASNIAKGSRKYGCQHIIDEVR